MTVNYQHFHHILVLIQAVTTTTTQKRPYAKKPDKKNLNFAKKKRTINIYLWSLTH